MACCVATSGGAVCGGIMGVVYTSTIPIICAIAYAIMRSNNPDARLRPLVLFACGTIAVSFVAGAVIGGIFGAVASQAQNDI